MDGPPTYHKHLRLPGNDYSQGAYFVTLCTRPRKEWYGRIVGVGADAVMEPNDLGRIVINDWNALPEHFPHLRLDQMQLMPDHLHGIIVLHGATSHAGGSTRRVDATVGPLDDQGRPRGPAPGSLGAIIAAFKSGTTIKMNRLNATLGQRYWQRGYHERYIRRQVGEFERIAHYIAENPANWR